MDPWGFLVALARLLGLVQYIQKRDARLIEPGDEGAPPPRPKDDIDPDVARAIERGEI